MRTAHAPDTYREEDDDMPKRVMVPSAIPVGLKGPEGRPPSLSTHEPVSAARGQSGIHPKLGRLRDELKRSVEWIVGLMKETLPPHGDLEHAAQVLKGLSAQPSQRVMPELQNAMGLIHGARLRARKAASSRPGGDPDAATRPYDDVMTALQTTMHAAGRLTGSTATDRELYRKHMPGYVDKSGEWHVRKPTDPKITDTESVDRWLELVEAYAMALVPGDDE